MSGNVDEFEVRFQIGDIVSQPQQTADGYIVLDHIASEDIKYVVTADGYYPSVIEGNTANLFWTVIDLIPIDVGVEDEATTTITNEVAAGNIAIAIDTSIPRLTVTFDYTADRTFTAIEVVALVNWMLVQQEYASLIARSDNISRVAIGLDSLHIFGEVQFAIADGNSNIVEFDVVVSSSETWDPTNDQSNSVIGSSGSGEPPDERQLLNAINSFRDHYNVTALNHRNNINDNTNAARDNINTHTTVTGAITNTRVDSARDNINTNVDNEADAVITQLNSNDTDLRAYVDTVIDTAVTNILEIILIPMLITKQML